jgi:hypothetical protein
MKMIPISLEIPKEADDAFKEEARQRMISKSAVVREILVDYYRTTLIQRKQQSNRQLAAKGE